MAVTIGSNIGSLIAQRRLNDASRLFERTLEKLSSGMRINSASDDAAGLAISDTLNASSRVFGRAILNLNDGISALNISEGALRQLSSIVTRQLELSEQAANGVYSVAQRRALHSEANSLVNEFNRIIGSTTFNGQRVLDGSYDSLRLQAGYGLDGSLLVGIGTKLQRNIGTGHFDSAITVAVNAQRDVRTADFNNDGILDIASAGTDNNIRVSFGDGAGSFGASVLVGNPGNINDIMVADVNNDGLEDIVASSSGGLGELSVFLATGAGTFGARQGYAVGDDPAGDVRGLALGDLNGDGFLDIVTGTGGSDLTTHIFLNNRNGTYTESNSFLNSGGGNIWSYALADVNHDGHLDLAVGDASNAPLRVHLGSGNGTFGSAFTVQAVASAFEVEFFDVNEDGHNDLLFTQNGGNFNVALGRGDGTFGTATSYAIAGFTATRDFEIGDLTGDGIEDIVVVDQNANQAAILIGRLDGTFGSPEIINSATQSRGLALGDADGDGVLDIISGGTSVAVHLGQSEEGSTVGRLYLLSAQGARESLEACRAILNRINLEFGALGAHRSRIDIASNTLAITRENYLAANGRIRDADLAEETAVLTRARITQSIASSILAQANQTPELALTLLEGVNQKRR